LDLKLGIRPIWEKFLQTNYLFALEFSEGFVFGRVIRRKPCIYKPWSLINSSGTAVTISPESHQSELRFRDPRNTEDDILYLDSSTNAGYAWILHGSIGIKPEQILMYPKFPEAQEVPGKFPSIDPIRPSSGDKTGYVNSLLSPYESPTDFIEYVIPPYIHVGAEYYNTDSNLTLRPVMNLLFTVYWFQVLTPERHRNLIGKIANREVPASFLTVGWGATPIQMGETLKRDWKVNPLSLEEATGFGGR
jgi:hypothetical protein